MNNDRWSGRATALALAAVLVAPGVAWAQLSVSLGNNAARPVPNAVDAADAPAISMAPAVGATGARGAQPSQVSRSGQAPEPLPANPRDSRPPTSLMGMGASTPPLGAVDLGAVLNTGSRIQRDNADKICPPGLVNRNNFCTPPASGLMTR